MQLELASGAAPAPSPRQTTPVIMTKAEYARHYGCKPPFVSKLIKQGKLTHPALLDDGRINRLLADRQLASLRDPARYSKRSSSILIETEDDDRAEGSSSKLDDVREGPVFAVERAHGESLKRQLREIELAKLKGQLVLREDVERSAEASARILKNKILEIPTQLACVLINQESEQQIALILREAFVKCLSEAASEIESGRSFQEPEKEGELTDNAE